MFDRYTNLTSFLGGENTRLPATDLQDDEAVKITNLVPSKDGAALAVRGGLNTISTDWLVDGTTPLDKPIVGLYRYNHMEATGGRDSHDIIATAGDPTDTRKGARVYYRKVGTNTLTLLYTFPDITEGAVRFATLLGKLFFVNGWNHAVMWDGVEGNAATTVKDSLLLEGLAFPFIVTHRDRLWLGGASSTVMYCGSDDGDKPRWESWQGLTPSDGGSLVVSPDDGQQVTGLAAISDSLIIFKERGTYIWSYSDDAIPKIEGTVAPYIRGVGCASHDTIAYYRGSVIFLGQTDDWQYGVYSISGSSVTSLSDNVPSMLKRIINGNTKAVGFVHDDTYYLAAQQLGDAANDRTLVYALHLPTRAWYEVKGWSVGAFGRSSDGSKLRVGSAVQGSIAEYPIGTTDDGRAIAYELQTRAITGGNEQMEKRWRSVSVDADTTATSHNVEVRVSGDERYPSKSDLKFRRDVAIRYNSGVLYNSGSPYPTFRRVVRGVMNLTERARILGVNISGAISDQLRILRVGASVRNRKVRNQ